METEVQYVISKYRLGEDGAQVLLGSSIIPKPYWDASMLVPKKDEPSVKFKRPFYRVMDRLVGNDEG